MDGKTYLAPTSKVAEETKVKVEAAREVKRINAHTWVVTLKSAGKLVHETREVVSDDGKTLTATGTVSAAFSANGQAHDFTMIYTRQ